MVEMDKDGFLVDSSVFESGKKISSVAFRAPIDTSYKLKRLHFFKVANGDSSNINGFPMVETEAEFPGGSSAWRNYLVKATEKNIDWAVDLPESGACYVRFIVDKDGAVTNVHALNMNGSNFARAIEQAIIKGPKWQPARINGQPVKASHLQKVSIQNIDL